MCLTGNCNWLDCQNNSRSWNRWSKNPLLYLWFRPPSYLGFIRLNKEFIVLDTQIYPNNLNKCINTKQKFKGFFCIPRVEPFGVLNLDKRMFVSMKNVYDGVDEDEGDMMREQVQSYWYVSTVASCNHSPIE